MLLTKQIKKDETTKAKPAKKKKASKSGLLFLSIGISVAIIAALGFISYNGWQQLKQQQSLIQTQQQQIQQITDKQNQVSRDVQIQLQQNTLAQNTELTTLKETIAAFLKQNQHTRRDWLIAEAEYLVKLANHRLILSHDVSTSIQALRSADNRLREVGNPKFIPVREALANDIQKFSNIPAIDYVGLSLALNALQQQIESLPLVTPDPKTVAQRKNEASNVSTIEKWQQLPAAIWQDLLKLFRIQKHNEEIKPLILPEQRFYLVQNLKLQLEQARLALLNSHPVIFKDRIYQAQQWVNQYFDKNHSNTQSVISSLDKLAATNIQLKLPDISKSLSSLQLLNPNNKKTAQEKAVKKRAPAKKIVKPKPVKQAPAKKEEKPEAKEPGKTEQNKEQPKQNVEPKTAPKPEASQNLPVSKTSATTI